MEIMFSNGVQYSIEFIKLILVIVCVLNIRVKKSINSMFGVSLIGVMTISYWFDMSQYSNSVKITVPSDLEIDELNVSAGTSVTAGTLLATVDEQQVRQ